MEVPPVAFLAMYQWQNQWHPLVSICDAGLVEIEHLQYDFPTMNDKPMGFMVGLVGCKPMGFMVGLVGCKPTVL